MRALICFRLLFCTENRLPKFGCCFCFGHSIKPQAPRFMSIKFFFMSKKLLHLQAMNLNNEELLQM